MPHDGGEGWRLARIGCASAEAWNVSVRPLGVRDEAIDAISVKALRWNDRTNGTKHGDWSAYRAAMEAAEAAGCDAALLIHEHAVIDGDRSTPMVLDEDGTVWMAHPSEGGVDGVLADVLASLLPSLGMPVVKGKLNERTVARCAEFVLVGTGMGVCRVNTIDGVKTGNSTVLSTACHRLLSQHLPRRPHGPPRGRTMSKRVMAVVEQLLADELLGEPAFRHGAPDRGCWCPADRCPILLLGPWWPHLPRSVVVRQPGRDVYRPLRCTNRFLATFNWLAHPLLEAEVEEWKHGSWYHSVTFVPGIWGTSS